MSKDPTPPQVLAGQQSGKPESRTSLARTLGRSTATLMTASMIIGTGIFGALGSATAKAGSGILISMTLGGLIALATGISAAQLGVNYPKEGGAFTWSREFNHKTVGFIAGCAYLGKGIFSLSVISLAFASYSVQIIPGLPIQLFAGIVILAVIFLNFFHVQLTTKVLISLMVVNVSLLGLFVAFSTPAVNPSHFSNLLGDNGPFGVLAGAAIFFWTWDGFMRTAIMAGEIKNPRRTMTIGMIVLVLALSFDLRRLLAVASIFTLTWYIITHFSALQLRKEQRLTTPFFSWLGLLGCLLLVASLPIWATLTGSAVLATLAGFRWLWLRYRTPKVAPSVGHGAERVGGYRNIIPLTFPVDYLGLCFVSKVSEHSGGGPGRWPVPRVLVQHFLEDRNHQSELGDPIEIRVERVPSRLQLVRRPTRPGITCHRVHQLDKIFGIHRGVRQHIEQGSSH